MVYGSGFVVQGVGFRAEVWVCEVYGFGFGIWGLGFRVKGSGSGV